MVNRGNGGHFENFKPQLHIPCIIPVKFHYNRIQKYFFLIVMVTMEIGSHFEM